MADEALNIFISYSHRDEVLKDELVNLHLKPLKRDGKISTWQDRDIEAGAEWAQEIKAQLEQADIVLLLVTRHFLASDYCYVTEMQRAVERHQEGTARVIPIILEVCGWKYSPFTPLQVLPRDGKPVTQWADRAEAFFDIEEGIRCVVNRLNESRRQAAVKQAQATERLRQQEAETLQKQQIGKESLKQEKAGLYQTQQAAEQQAAARQPVQKLQQQKTQEISENHENLLDEPKLGLLPKIGFSVGRFIRGFQDASREFEEEFKKESERIEKESSQLGNEEKN